MNETPFTKFRDLFDRIADALPSEQLDLQDLLCNFWGHIVPYCTYNSQRYSFWNEWKELLPAYCDYMGDNEAPAFANEHEACDYYVPQAVMLTAMSVVCMAPENHTHSSF